MALDISGAQITATASEFKLKNTSSSDILTRGISSNYAFSENPSVPAFVAGNLNDASWVIPVSSGVYGKINQYCTLVSYNNGGHYNTSTTRFTAPYSGPYWFSFNVYLYTANYVHPLFAINGATTTGYGAQIRMRGHGMLANYQQDAQIEEVVFLNAGDYIEAWWYANGASYMLPSYSLFQGVYIG